MRPKNYIESLASNSAVKTYRYSDDFEIYYLEPYPTYQFNIRDGTYAYRNAFTKKVQFSSKGENICIGRFFNKMNEQEKYFL